MKTYLKSTAVKAWTYIKGLRWVVTLGAVLTAILFALAGARSLKRKASAAKREEQIKVLMETGISSDMAKASALAKKAADDKFAAKQAKQDMQNRLEQLGNANEDIDSIADEFNSRRRVRSDPET